MPNDVRLHFIRLDQSNTPHRLRELISLSISIPRRLHRQDLKCESRSFRCDFLLHVLAFIDFTMEYFMDSIIIECGGRRMVCARAEMLARQSC